MDNQQNTDGLLLHLILQWRDFFCQTFLLYYHGFWCLCMEIKVSSKPSPHFEKIIMDNLQNYFTLALYFSLQWGFSPLKTILPHAMAFELLAGKSMKVSSHGLFYSKVGHYRWLIQGVQRVSSIWKTRFLGDSWDAFVFALNNNHFGYFFGGVDGYPFFCACRATWKLKIILVGMLI